MIQEIQKKADSKPLLTIAIPTYNRARYLGELLAALFDQLVPEPRVELLISDNASPDETPSVIREYQERGLQLRNIRNEINIGPDANFLQCFEQSQGKYVWIFGDDDILVPGGLAAILSHLERRVYDLVYLSSFPLVDSYQPRQSSAKAKAIELQDPKLFASYVHIFFTFISGNIVNKERVQAQKQSSFDLLLGSNLMQLGWTYAALNGFDCGLFISDKLIGARVDNTGGYKLMEVFGSTLKSVTERWLNSKDLRHIIYNGTLQRFWPGMMVQYKVTAANFGNEANPNHVLSPVFGDNLRYWTFVYPTILLPYRLAAFWLLLVRIVNRVDRACGFVLVRGGKFVK
jgi:glycosyltransferase involved in cell wall biosynthesis